MLQASTHEMGGEAEMIDQDSASEGDAFGARDTGTIDDLVRDLLLESDETAIMYLRESWIASAFALLQDTRRAAGYPGAARRRWRSNSRADT